MQSLSKHRIPLGFLPLMRDPVTRSVGDDGTEQITGIRHYWRVFQRNIPDYDSRTGEAP